MAFEIRELSGSEAREIVLPLYSQEGNGIEIRDADLFFVAFRDQEIVGSVRFCIEQGIPMLRTMRIAERFQGQGFGRMLLKHFETYLENERIGEAYCIPYAHLERFYGQIGFKTVNEESIPGFLVERLRQYRTKGVAYLCMSRKLRDRVEEI